MQLIQVEASERVSAGRSKHTRLTDNDPGPVRIRPDRTASSRPTWGFDTESVSATGVQSRSGQDDDPRSFSEREWVFFIPFVFSLSIFFLALTSNAMFQNADVKNNNNNKKKQNYGKDESIDRSWLTEKRTYGTRFGLKVQFVKVQFFLEHTKVIPTLESLHSATLPCD